MGHCTRRIWVLQLMDLVSSHSLVRYIATLEKSICYRTLRTNAGDDWLGCFCAANSRRETRLHSVGGSRETTRDRTESELENHVPRYFRRTWVHGGQVMIKPHRGT